MTESRQLGTCSCGALANTAGGLMCRPCYAYWSAVDDSEFEPLGGSDDR